MSVVKFYPADAAKNVDNVLEQAMGVYDSAIIIGWDKNGELDVRSSTNLNKAEIAFLVGHFSHNLFNGDYDDVR